jgi:hypothetical protein
MHIIAQISVCLCVVFIRSRISSVSVWGGPNEYLKLAVFEK